MSRLFGWDLPPGVRVSDIPGNRPEDEEWENIYNNFWDKERLTKTHIGTLVTEQQYETMGELYESNNPNLADEIDAYISAAIEYGMEIGEKKNLADEQMERDSLAAWHEEIRNPKLRMFFKAQRQASKGMYKVLRDIIEETMFDDKITNWKTWRAKAIKALRQAEGEKQDAK